jgi:hypothetical protein
LEIRYRLWFRTAFATSFLGIVIVGGAAIALQGVSPWPLVPMLLGMWACLYLGNVAVARWRFARGLGRALREALVPSR